MRISLHWLQQYVEVKESLQELADLLTMLGFEAELATDFSALSGVVTAKILAVSSHPNADRLHLCQVTDGKDEWSI
ncbi:MAG: hypothetical protein D6762_09735, partial [Candidatus Neomarinimicrobiota bacterium]